MFCWVRTLSLISPPSQRELPGEMTSVVVNTNCLISRSQPQTPEIFPSQVIPYVLLFQEKSLCLSRLLFARYLANVWMLRFDRAWLPVSQLFFTLVLPERCFLPSTTQPTPTYPLPPIHTINFSLSLFLLLSLFSFSLSHTQNKNFPFFPGGLLPLLHGRRPVWFTIPTGMRMCAADVFTSLPLMQLLACSHSCTGWAVAGDGAMTKLSLSWAVPLGGLSRREDGM